MQKSDEEIIKNFNEFFNNPSKDKNYSEELYDFHQVMNKFFNNPSKDKSYFEELYDFHQVMQEELAIRTPESLNNLVEHVYVMGHQHGFKKGLKITFNDIQNKIKELESDSKI
jgi:hypothetical protein